MSAGLYAITLNGSKRYCVKTLDDARNELAIVTIDTVNCVIDGRMVGALIAIDGQGNRWSVCRVTPSVAALVQANADRRWKARWRRHLAKFAK